MAKAKKPALAPARLAQDFTRGLVAAGLLAAIQDRRVGPAQPSPVRVLRLAVQGGAAIAAGAATARSLRQGDNLGALIALAGGAAAIFAAETLMATPTAPSPQENEDV